ncbi:prepilin peptidase-dependent protein, partial [Salmonella enterica subsp. enterica serovar Typhimurium]|nr:prepilin peptidase-dependent protein [Salmonella enterica subsp. enterica serovar Typhimurium]
MQRAARHELFSVTRRTICIWRSLFFFRPPY